MIEVKVGTLTTLEILALTLHYDALGYMGFAIAPNAKVQTAGTSAKQTNTHSATYNTSSYYTDSMIIKHVELCALYVYKKKTTRKEMRCSER